MSWFDVEYIDLQSDELPQSYFQTAAKLGDPDAQQELAFCLLNGKGCKKDKKEAAKWYRAAVRLLRLSPIPS